MTSTRPASLNVFAPGQARVVRDAHAVERDLRPARSRAPRPCRRSSRPRSRAWSVSTRKPLTWPSSSERAHTTTTSAIEPLPIQRLAPSSTQPSPSRRALVSSATESEPCVGLGQRERADRVEPRHRRQPALLLLLGAEQLDRLHRQPGLHAEERAEAAVAAVQLHVDQAAGERAHARAAVALDVLAVEAELGEPAHQRPRQLGGLPVLVDRRQDLLVDEPAGGDEVLPLLVGELLADVEVVGGERLAEVGVGQGLRRSSDRSSQAAWT